MGILVNNHLCSGSSKLKGAPIFESLFSPQDFTTIVYSDPKDYVTKYWTAYKALGYRNNSLNGQIFEFIIETLLIREGIVPFYTQAEMSFIPAVKYDVILYSRDKIGVKPYSLSLKTSCRERWKQADLEAEALKKVHRRAMCYLLTISAKEAKNVQAKIRSSKAFALDRVVDCLSDDINVLCKELRSVQFDYNEDLPVIKSGQCAP